MSSNNAPPKNHLNANDMAPDKSPVSLAEQYYVALSQHNALSGETNETKKRQIVFNDVVQLASGNPHIDQAWVLAHINQSLPLRRAYKECLLKLAFSHSPVQAAASTNEVFPQRENSQFRLRFKQNKLNPQQVYGLLDLYQPNHYHIRQGVLLNIEQQDQFYRVAFPPLNDNLSQKLFSLQDPVLEALLNPASEIMLMPK